MFELEIGEVYSSSCVLMVMYDRKKDEEGRLGSYWRLNWYKQNFSREAMPSTDGWEGQTELVELDGA